MYVLPSVRYVLRIDRKTDRRGRHMLNNICTRTSTYSYAEDDGHAAYLKNIKVTAKRCPALWPCMHTANPDSLYRSKPLHVRIRTSS